MAPQPITSFHEFTTLAHHVVTSDRAVIVSVGDNTKVAIVPVDEYEDAKRIRENAKKDLFAVMDELHRKNVHLDPQQVEDEIFNATMEIRYGAKPTL